MDKMFKRTLLGAAIAMAAVGSSANAAIDLNGKAVQVYGQAAGFVTIASPDKGDDKVSATIESRIGFRGVVEFQDFGPDLLWQIEGGDANNSDKSGQLGARDTYLGLGFDGVGSIKYGRQLVAAYNYVDWPHSNPGLGNVFDWNNDIREEGQANYQDRADNVIRFDSETFGGFNYQVTLSGMEDTVDGLVINVAGSYQAGPVNLHAGMYHQGTYENKTKGGLKYYLVGATAGFDNWTLTGALKFMENDLNDGEQMAYSVTGQYVNNSWVYKLGVSGTNDAKFDGNKKADTKDLAVTARLGYLLPSTYLFMDLRNYKMNNADGFDNNLLIGAEYYF